MIVFIFIPVLETVFVLIPALMDAKEADANIVLMV